jgi:hypothetical protein
MGTAEHARPVKRRKVPRTPHTVARDSEGRVEVSDWGDGGRTMGLPGAEDQRGPGLLPVENLADDWGFFKRAHEIGKTVWVLLKPG